MAQTTAILTTLKKRLKAQGLTYSDVADSLNLTEASVKRLFAQKSFSLQRLDKVCHLLDMEISDLLRGISEENARLLELAEEQEAEIAGDITLLLVTVCVLNRWTLPEIIGHYDISETECIRYLARLDRLRIIELLPANRIKLLVAPNFQWRENGPIQGFFQSRVESDFFNSRFDKSTEKLVVLNGMFADESILIFKRKLDKLAQEFNELNDDDAIMELEHRHGTTLVLAIRQWEYGLFTGLRRSGK
jgi:transcriptional regulator with XRE-family HTH domain